MDDPAEADYEVTFIANNLNVLRYGMVIEVTDLSGTADTAADNIQSMGVGFNPGSGTMDWWYTNAVGAILSFTNAPSFVLFSSLPTSITITAGNTYGITCTRSADTLTWYLWDEATDLLQEVASFALDAGELALFPGTVKGAGINFLHSSSNDGVDSMRALSFRVAPANVLVNDEVRGAASEVNRYVIYNYEETTWAIGEMCRTSWHDRSPVFNKPYSAGEDSFLYQHEVGGDDDGVAMDAFIESYDMEIPEAGEYLMHVDQLIPDFVTLEGSVDITLKAKPYPHAANYTVKGPYPVTTMVRKISTRIRGRQVALRIDSSAIGDKWRMGTMRARLAPHGKRS
jgi:hypothetical protein